MQKAPKVINVALNAGYEPLALLCEQKHITGDAAGIIERCDDIPVYTGERKLLATLTGYTLTRGVLCAMHRPTSKSVEEICRGARRIVVIEGVVDTTNIGAIFRSAAALGDRCHITDTQFLRPVKPTCSQSFNGFCLPDTMGLVGWFSQ